MWYFLAMCLSYSRCLIQRLFHTFFSLCKKHSLLIWGSTVRNWMRAFCSSFQSLSIGHLWGLLRQINLGISLYVYSKIIFILLIKYYLVDNSLSLFLMEAFKRDLLYVSVHVFVWVYVMCVPVPLGSYRWLWAIWSGCWELNSAWLEGAASALNRWTISSATLMEALEKKKIIYKDFWNLWREEEEGKLNII